MEMHWWNSQLAVRRIVGETSMRCYFLLRAALGSIYSMICGSSSVLTTKEMADFRKDYTCNSCGEYNLEVQVPHLKKMAERYSKRYGRYGHWTDMLKAHSLWNSVGVRCASDDTWTEKAYRVQMMYWQGAENTSFEQQKSIISKFKTKLEKIRQNIRQQLRMAEGLAAEFGTETDHSDNPTDQLQSFYKAVEACSVDCTNQMIELSRMVFEESVKTLREQPPCHFCVVAIGSIAKGETTPYSDLEYLFLIEKKDEQTERYFEQLAITSYFLIGNLRETKLHYMNIAELAGWFDDHQKNGFKIDGLAKGAGNIPTGNGSSNPNNHFIVTADELLQRYREVLDNPDPDEAKRGDLTAMLQYTKLIYKSGREAEGLLKQFESQRNKLKTNQAREKSNQKMFLADVKKYNFRPDETLVSKGYTVNSKRELYRYPSILLFNISILTKQSKASSWDTLRFLQESGTISQTLYHSLTFLLACACYFRLSAYLYHDSQDDRLTVLPEGPTTRSPKESLSAAGRRWHLPQGLFNIHCEHTILVKDHISRCSTRTMMACLKMELPQLGWLMKFYVYYCCNRWKEGLNFFHVNVSERALDEHPKNVLELMCKAVGNDVQGIWHLVKALNYCLFQFRKWSTALHCGSIAQAMIERISEAKVSQDKSHQLILADIFHEMGNCYNNLQDCSKAKEQFIKALKIRQQHLNPEDNLIALSHYAIGDCEKSLRNLDVAEQQSLQALQIAYANSSKVIEYDYYGDPINVQQNDKHLVDLATKSAHERLRYLNHPTIMLARVTWNLGRTYFHYRRYQDATDYWKKAQEILEALYGSTACHRELGSISLNYAMGCNMVGRHMEADGSFRKAFAIYTRVCSNAEDQLLVVLTNADRRSSRRRGGGHYYEVAVKTFLSLPGFNILHPQTAAVLRYYSLHLVYMKQYDLAERLLKQCLEIYEVAVRDGTEDHYQEATAYVKSVLALKHWKTGQVDQAERLYTEALKLRMDDNKVVQLHAAEILQEMGAMYTASMQYEDARKCISLALGIYQQICRVDHPKVLEAKEQLSGIGYPHSRPMKRLREGRKNAAKVTKKRKVGHD